MHGENYQDMSEKEKQTIREILGTQNEQLLLESKKIVKDYEEKVNKLKEISREKLEF